MRIIDRLNVRPMLALHDDEQASVPAVCQESVCYLPSILLTEVAQSRRRLRQNQTDRLGQIAHHQNVIIPLLLHEQPLPLSQAREH